MFDQNFVPYRTNDALWVITVYYNPCRFISRRSTYDTFINTMQVSGVNVITVECAFGNDPFVLPDSDTVIKIRSNSLLWQKERLINIGAAYLPERCRYVAWIDCDIILENKHWIEETCTLLAHDRTIVQLWQTCVRLERGDVLGAKPESITSFAEVTTRDMTTLNQERYDRHGHTGYAWAMRREIFDVIGLYEHAVSGSADHFMCHALYGHYGFCIENALKHDPTQIAHLKSWGDAFYAQIAGKLGVVNGNILHLWHGSQDRRDYFRRMWKITEYGYNPDTDLLALPGRPLEWQSGVATNKPELVAYFAKYFDSRKEDNI